MLSHSKLNSVTDCLMLCFEGNEVIHHAILKVIHVPLLVSIELTYEALEGLACLSLSRLRAATKVLSDAVLQDLIDKVRVSERLLFLGVLPYDTH